MSAPIVFPEGSDPRVIEAARRLASDSLVRPILLGKPQAHAPDGVTFIDPLTAPALKKYPLLALFQEFLREQGAVGTLMSGSGSTTFAIFESEARAREVEERFSSQFGDQNWMAVVRTAG